MKAIVLDAENHTATVSSLPLASTGRVVGSDFAGLVVARGPPAPPAPDATATNAGSSRLCESSTALSSSISRGDRVAGFLQGACSVNERPGAFAEYVVCPADLVWRIPDHIPFEEAASVSLCGLTAAQGLFFRMGLEAPFQWDDESDDAVLRRLDREGGSGGGVRGEADFSFFISGASTSVGMYVAQLVRRSAEISGRRVRLIGAASPRNWEVLRAEPYGYEVLVDYRDASWPVRVRQAAGGGVHFAYDAISEGATVKEVSSTLRPGGKIAVVRSREAGAWDADGVTTEPIYGAVWEGLGEDVEYHKLVVRTSPAKKSFATAFYKWLSDGGLLHPNPVRVMPGGLQKVVEDGFSLLGTGVSDRTQERIEEHMRPISGEKLVYKIEGERTGEGLGV
ncbi:hypothetical protein K438DRAFT_1959697 [Mycena galopus ATCC 62051]|nr:hypothetical protein K438DRAFT_1959697 [Mycena galopus ATCC 62051]